MHTPSLILKSDIVVKPTTLKQYDHERVSRQIAEAQREPTVHFELPLKDAKRLTEVLNHYEVAHELLADDQFAAIAAYVQLVTLKKELGL